jgi:alkylation response protein AidB-like acyl-CoA dehydrogenase
VDFSFSEDQEALRDLARRILTEQVSPDRLKELRASGEHTDGKAWRQLADAGLVGISLPADAGGSGLGFLETCLVLEEIGRTVAPVPFYATVVLGALPVAEFGTDAQREDLLPPVVTGDLVLTAALVEPTAAPDEPATTAVRAGDGWRLDGVKVCVPAGLDAGRILVPARTGERTVGVFVVHPAARGVTVSREDTTSGIPEARVQLDGVEVGADAVLGDADGGRRVLGWMLERATAGLCVIATGVCEQALRMTAEYTSSRKQFDKVIGTFQAVGQRAADAYIDTEAVRLTAWQAAWRLHEGRPAAAEIATAKYWAAAGGQRVVHAAQHLHGGIGVDRDYPLHRYFLWAKQLELSLGGATAQLRRLGALLAADPV